LWVFEDTHTHTHSIAQQKSIHEASDGGTKQDLLDVIAFKGRGVKVEAKKFSFQFNVSTCSKFSSRDLNSFSNGKIVH